MDELNGAGLFAVPLNQACRLQLPPVRQHREMAHGAPIRKQFPLFVANADGHVAQRLQILLLHFLAGHERDVGALADFGRMRLAAPFVGCLPAPVQERFEHEYNVRASTMSLASALPLWILGWISLILLLASSVGGAGFLPTPVLVFGVYLLAESTAR